MGSKKRRYDDEYEDVQDFEAMRKGKLERKEREKRGMDIRQKRRGKERQRQFFAE